MKIKENKTLILTGMVFLTIAQFFVLIHDAQGQTDSLKYSIEKGNDSLVAYLSPIEYAFMFHEETNWLFKANVLATSEYNGTANLKLSLEKKILKNISLNAVLFNYTSFNLGVNPGPYNEDGIEFSIESRWYYKNRKLRRNNQPSANLSGAYLAVGAGYRKAFTGQTSFADYTDLEFIPLFAKWGMQRRFLKRGFVDVGIMAGWNHSMNDEKWSTVFFNTYVEAGLAFTRDKYKLDFEKLCPVLKCHAADHFLLKTNLVNIINLAYVREAIVGSVTPNIAAEFKLGESPFSVNTKVACKFQYSKASSFDFNSFSVSPNVLIEGRYYYNLNRRILMGKTGNGLSANYISLGATYQGEYYNHLSNGCRSKEGSSLFGIMAGTGIQRLISKHLYLDLNIGFGYGIEYYHHGYSGTQSNQTRSAIPIFNLGFGIGYRF
ncbi:MAG: DUF3575 domain-containing protein [Bacteroidales bacterium]|nr:DUF3575 domain-containing protein [Bacteroidales bacterium]